MTFTSKNIASYLSETFRVSPVWTLTQLFVLTHFDATQSQWKIFYHLSLRVVLITFYGLCFAAAVHFNNMLSFEHVPIIYIIGNTLNIYFGFGIFAFAYWQLMRKLSHLDKIFEMLSAVDRKIIQLFGNELKIGRCQRILFRFELNFVLCMGTSFILIGIYDIIVFRPYCGDIVFAFYVAYAYPHVIGMLITLQFISTVKLIQLRFDIINESLTHLLANCETTSTIATSPFDNRLDAAVIGLNNVNPIFCISNGNFSNNVDETSATKSKRKNFYQNISQKSLQTLFELHDNLLDISERVNQCYSSNAIIYVAVSFVFAMYGLFFEIKEIFYDYAKHLSLSLLATSYMLWGIQCLSTIFVLLSVCERTRDAAYETPLIVHKIIQKKPMFMLQNDVYYNKMKSFTVHLLHRKKTFNFSGQGMFNFDFTFIFSAVSAGASYLVVLLQFDMTFDREWNQ